MFNKKENEVTGQTEKSAELLAKKEENAELYEQLTNKNREYMVKLNRSLDDRRVSEERKTLIYNDMLKNIVEQQGKHVTARRIYGTVTDQADYLTENQTASEQGEVVRSEPWKLYLDGALTAGGAYTGITGLISMFTDQEATMRLFMAFLAFVLGGFAFMVIAKYAPVPGQKGGFLKYVLATSGVMIAFVLLMTLGSLAGTLNPVLSPTISVIIGVVAIAAKIYLKRRLNIQGTLF